MFLYVFSFYSKGLEIDRERDLSYAGSLPKYPHQPGPGQAKARNSIWSPTQVIGTQPLEPSPATPQRAHLQGDGVEDTAGT